MSLLYRGAFAVLLLVGGASHAGTNNIVDDTTLAAAGDGSNWLAYGRNYSERRYSPLDQVNADNVGQLGLAWFLELPEARTLVSTPLVVDGVLYFTGSYSVTRAVDAATGKLLWEYDPKAMEHAGSRARVMWDTSRGLAFWEGKVIIATIDGRLIALDAETGEAIWETMTVDPDSAFYVTGAPKVFRGKVIIGNGGTENDAARGYVTAYDADTGEQAWRFYIVPGNPADGFESEAMEMAAKTWTGQWWEHGGGGNTWNGITYDPYYNQILIGTGNGSPWNRKIRSPGGGDNLFLCSIVALDADTGEYKWHYQTVPGETWDYNSSMDIVLAELKLEGKTRKVLLHAPKNGFFYVIDRATGELLSAEKIGKVTWASHIDPETGRPVENPDARYKDGKEKVWPGPFGVHNWHAMSYNPNTGLVYIPTIEMAAVYKDSGIDIKAWTSPHFGFSVGVAFGGENPPPGYGDSYLIAWDPIEQKKVWQHKLPGVWNPGTMTTHGNLVFQGRADGDFVAYDATSGEPLWSVNVGSGISAPPITYAIDGKQYISLLVGWGGAAAAIGGSIGAQHGWAYGVHPRRLLTFALDGEVAMPPSPPPAYAQPLAAPEFEVNDDLAAHGEGVYVKRCFLCHGPGAVAGGYAPDLRASPIPTSREAFKQVVTHGRLTQGMPPFHTLSAKDIESLMHYIRQQARASLQAAKGGANDNSRADDEG